MASAAVRFASSKAARIWGVSAFRGALIRRDVDRRGLPGRKLPAKTNCWSKASGMLRLVTPSWKRVGPIPAARGPVAY